jgi:hypothetical protein
MFSEDEIRSKALELANAGVQQKDIEVWIQTARQERDALSKQPVGAEAQPPPSMSQSQADVEALKQYGMTGAEMGLRGGAIAAGQAAGLRAPGITRAAAVPLAGAVSAGLTDVAIQRAKGQPYSLGQTMQESAIGTLPGIGVTPAGQAGARSVMQAVRNIAPQALEYFTQPQGFRTLATLYGATAANTGMEEGRAPSGSEVAGAVAGTALAGATRKLPQTSKQAEQATRMVDDAVTNTNAREWIARGGKIDPTLTYRDSALNRGLSEVAGGSIEIQRAANETNQRLINQLAREDIGLVGAPLTSLHIQDRIIKMSGSARDIAGLGTNFADKIDEVRVAREAARDAWTAYKNEAAKGRASTETRQNAQNLTKAAVAVEDSLETMLTNAGEKDLLKQYARDRASLAKAYAYRDALIEGNISAKIISDHRNIQQRQMTGNLDLIARVHDSMPKVMRDLTEVQPVSENIPLMLRRSLGALAGAGTVASQAGISPSLMAMGGLAGSMAPTGARNVMMSPLYQRTMAAPRYGPEDPAMAASLARFAGIGATQ